MTDLTVSPDNVFSLVPSEEELEADGESLSFVPVMILLQGSSPGVGENGLEQGQYFIGVTELNLGREVEIVVVHRRHHALIIENGKKTLETFNKDSAVWKKIKAIKTDFKKGIKQRCGTGDWLIYLPEHNIFVTFLCGQAALFPFTVDVAIYLTPPEKRKLKEDQDRKWTNHFTLQSCVKTWGKDFKAMSPKVKPLENFDVNTIDKEKATQAVEMFFAPVKAEDNVEETTEESR